MRMKKLIIFMMLFIASLSLTSCSLLNFPADIELIGSGYFQKENGLCFVEIDSVKYAPRFVYTNKSSRDGKQRMQPVDGMLVTAFRIYNNPTVEFIVGNQSEEYLKDQFSTYIGGYLMAGIICLLMLSILAWQKWKQATSQIDDYDDYDWSYLSETSALFSRGFLYTKKTVFLNLRTPFWLFTQPFDIALHGKQNHQTNKIDKNPHKR